MSDNPNSNQSAQPNQTGVTAPAPARVAAPGVTAPAAAASGRLDDATWSQIMNEWLNNNMRNSPVANNAESWNHLVSQLDALRKIAEKYL
jgi:hypothetical protein